MAVEPTRVNRPEDQTLADMNEQVFDGDAHFDMKRARSPVSAIARRVLEFSAGAQPDEISVFSQPWFVHLVYRQEYRAANAFNKAGKPICALSYGQTRVMGLFSKVTCLDRWGRLSSFVFLDNHVSDQERRDAVADILKQLPRSMAYCQFVLDDDSGIIRDAFIEAGFECTKMPKYIRPPSKQNYESICAYAQAKDSVMKTISKDGRARYQSTVQQVKIENISALDFCRFYESNLIGKGQESYSPLNIAETIIENGVRRRKVLTLAAKDKDGIEAAAVFLFDTKTIYAWLATRKYHGQGKTFDHQDKYKKFCIDVLVIEAMIFAEMHGLIYDAEIFPVEQDGVAKSPHRIFVTEKILHLTREDSRFLFERKGWLYDKAWFGFYKAREAAKRGIDLIARISSTTSDSKNSTSGQL